MSSLSIPSVLVVEDEPIVALDMERRLKVLGFTAYTASTGEEALQKTEVMDPALVLMDIVLPGRIDGVEAAQEIWDRFRTPIIYLTAYSDTSIIERAQATNPFGYLLKPLGDRELLATIKIALHKYDTEKKLRQSEERYRSLVTATSQIVWVTDANGRIVEDIPALRELTGFTFEQLKERGWVDALHPDDVDHIISALEVGITTARPFDTEYRLRGTDGKYRTFISRAVPIFSRYGELQEWIGTCTDITDQRDLEEQLRQSQRMEAIGSLAGGIAHDFNNLLTGIICYSEIAENSLDKKDPMHEDLEEIKLSAERAAALTRQLLTFSRKQVVQPQPIDINTLVAGLEKLLRRVIGEDIILTTSLDEPLGVILADPGQVEQVVMNLAVNARDAMERGGKLRIETKNVDVDSDYASRHVGMAAGPYVMLSVSDTGTGMDEKIQSRIFEPFFTTKPMGKGTGLGLSTVHGIVKQSGGTIEVYSETGIGTTFKVYFPRTDKEARNGWDITKASEASPRGTETILVAEDERVIRNLLRKVLTALGYNVLDAGDGIAALNLARSYNGPIHLLITDVIMPNMGGRDLVDRLTEKYPTIRTLFISGYTGGTVEDYEVPAAGTTFLQKPFSAKVLAAKVREVLDTLQ